jgi:hypothetical protein
MWLEEEQCWIMYYTATSISTGGYFVVAYRTSEDLYNWSSRYIAYYDYHWGNSYGNTESPFVVNRGNYYYLFVGPRPYDLPTEDLESWEHPGYVGTDVYRSTSWNQWTNADYVGHIEAHAPEVIQDLNGDWYISHAGVLQGGLFITPFYWLDGISSDLTFPKRDMNFLQTISISPNPFQSEVSIQYSINKTLHILVEIIDASGRKIKQLIDSEHLSGLYNLSWDGRNDNGEKVANGLYFCQFTADNKKELIKLLFLGD